MFWMRQENIFVGCDLSFQGDNRRELFEKFNLIQHPKYVAGYQWFCKKCGFPCKSHELWFPCIKKFVTTDVRCHMGCHTTWYFHINIEMPEERRCDG